MNIYWLGGEDTSFPNGGSVFVSTTAGVFRSGYSRCGVRNNSTALAKSTTFAGGALTSCWFGFWFTSSGSFTGNQCVLLGKSGTNLGIGFGQGSSNGRIAIVTYNGSTTTVLAQESGTSMTNSLIKIDIQLINLGASGTINLYLNGVFWLTYTGDLTIGSTLTSVDSVYLQSQTFSWLCSEMAVTDSDTRSLSLLTGAPNGSGTTQNWSNPANTNYNPIVINDANSTFTNTTAQNEQATLIDIPSGTFAVIGTKIESRALATAGATATQLKQGFNQGGTVAVGSAHTLSTAFATYEDYIVNDPATSAAFTQTGFNSVQLDLQS